MMRQHLYMSYTEQKKEKEKYMIRCIKQSLSHHSKAARMIRITSSLSKYCQGSLNPMQKYFLRTNFAEQQ